MKEKPRVTLGRLQRPWTIQVCECGERKQWAGDPEKGIRSRICPKCDTAPNEAAKEGKP